MVQASPKSAKPAVNTQQKVREAVAASQAKAATALGKVRDKLTSAAALQVELASVLGDKSMDPGAMKKRVTAISGSLARILSPYRAK